LEFLVNCTLDWYFISLEILCQDDFLF
jgi:hypothetical protein